MLKIEDKNIYNKDFIRYGIKNLIQSLLYQEITKNKTYNYINIYINKYYNLKLSNIIDLILKNLHVSISKNKFYVFLSNNVPVNKETQLETIINLIDYGNREIKGTYLFHKIFRLIQRNLFLFQCFYEESRFKQQ